MLVKENNTSKRIWMVDRGSVVLSKSLGKGPKHLSTQLRSHTTRSGLKSLASVQKQPEIPKGLLTLAKHWKICYDNPDRVFKDLRGIYKQESIWFAAYLKIKANKGSMTPGPDEEIIDSLTKKRILELRSAVLKNEFKWIGTRQVEIPKPGTKKKRPLGIPSINDRLVQEVIKSTIEPIFETNFSNLSHGFRPNRSCHIALKGINTHMKDSVWFIEGDIKSYFPTINHDVLMKLIEKRIQDPLLLKLIRKGLKAKVFQKDKQSFIPEIGTPQGGILSPLLSNIYLHELDKFTERLSIDYKGPVKPSNRKKNPVANKLLRTDNKKKYLQSRIPSRIPNETGYRNCKYTRYADDFVIGIVGPHSMAVEIREKIREFLQNELKLEMSIEKSKITHVSKGIEYLGYVFSRRFLITKQSYGKKTLKRKMTIPTLDVNMKKVIYRLATEKFCNRNGEPTPCFRFLRLPQSETNRKINEILRGLCQWWSIAGNRRQAVARTAYIIRYSIAKVYAAKFKLRTVAKVFKIGSNDLGKPIGKRAKSVVGADEKDAPQNKTQQLEGILYDRYWKIPKPEPNKISPTWKPEYEKTLSEGLIDGMAQSLWEKRKRLSKNPLAAMSWRLEKALSSQSAPCSICGSFENIEMHHVRSLKDID
jgi:group II intron reverse transcriptase/maturase